MVRKWIAAGALPLMLALSACQTGPTVVSDKHTGTTGIVSSRATAYSGLFSSIVADAIFIDKAGYGAELRYIGNSWLFPQEVWSYGTKYPFVPGATNVGGCSVSGCIITEDGIVKFTEAQFRKAAQEGFDFKIVGRNGAIEGQMPARLFQEVLDIQAGKKVSTNS